MENLSSKNIALLIDSENISPDYINLIIDEANKYGTINYRRVYGDWTKDQLKPWKGKCIEYGLTQVQQFSYISGKNSSDFTLVIDAMDILYKGKVDSFCIVTSDSDFTKLVTRLKEDNMYVFGMGESKTPISLVNSCETFSYLDKMSLSTNKELSQTEGETETETETKTAKTHAEDKNESSITPLNKIMKEFRTITKDNLEDDGWAYWGLVYDLFHKKFPGFDPRNYGSNLRPITFFKNKKDFEFEKRNAAMYLKIKSSK